ncbi:MAG: SIS domain-containing protein [Dehalococcoidia bacterium]|nr:SIS domain-containing protein [Dehalococcoidia bacterium]
MKEVSYVHAEGYAAGEMKHGPIALISPGFPAVVIATKHAMRSKMISNVEQLRARGASVIAIATEGDNEVQGIADATIFIPDVEPQIRTHPGFGTASAAGLPGGHHPRLRRRPASQPREDRNGRIANAAGTYQTC